MSKNSFDCRTPRSPGARAATSASYASAFGRRNLISASVITSALRDGTDGTIIDYYVHASSDEEMEWLLNEIDTREAGSLQVTGSDVRPFQFSTYVIPSNLWHRDSRLVEAFIDVERGNILSVRPRYLGKETLEQGGGVVEAHRYALRGQIDREAWYDSDCVLVRWDLPVAGGDWISFRRETA